MGMKDNGRIFMNSVRYLGTCKKYWVGMIPSESNKDMYLPYLMINHSLYGLCLHILSEFL